jgi:putative membrane protein
MREGAFRNVVIRWLINTLALFLVVSYLPGIHFEGGPAALLVEAAIFGVVNALLRPLLTILTCPLVLVTLGLFTLVINALLLLATASVSTKLGIPFHIDGFWPAFWGGLVIGVVSVFLSVLVGTTKVTVRKL